MAQLLSQRGSRSELPPKGAEAFLALGVGLEFRA